MSMRRLNKEIKDEAKRVLSGLKRHPADGNIAYVTENTPLVTFLVSQKFLKAAIFPVANPKKFNKAANQITIKQIKGLKRPPSLYYENDVLKIKNPLINTLKIKSKFGATNDVQMNSPSAADLKRLPAILLQEMKQSWNLLKQQTSEKNLKSQVYAVLPKSGENGFAPFFHAHDPVTVHTTLCGGALEFIAGDLTQEEQRCIDDIAHDGFGRHLNKEEITSLVDNFNYIPQLEHKIYKLGLGQKVLFGEDFYHRSSAEIPKLGQLSTAVEIEMPDLRGAA